MDGSVKMIRSKIGLFWYLFWLTKTTMLISSCTHIIVDIKVARYKSLAHSCAHTCEMFHWWLISATGSVATEQPHPTTAIFTGSDRMPSKKVSKVFSRWHYNYAERILHQYTNDKVSNNARKRLIVTTHSWYIIRKLRKDVEDREGVYSPSDKLPARSKCICIVPYWDS